MTLERESDDWQATYAIETRRLIRARLPFAVLFFVAVFAAAWWVEHGVHPARNTAYGILFFLESAIAFGAMMAIRAPERERATVGIVSAAAVAVCAAIGLYHVVVSGEIEVLALALVYIMTGTMIALPWGVRGQLPVAIAGVLTQAAAAAAGVPAVVSGSLAMLGLAAIAGMSVVGALFLDTARRQMAQQAYALRAANAALERANASKNEYIGIVSHELRTPVSTIMGYTELLLDDDYGPLPEAMRTAVERVRRAAVNMGQLINDLTDMSRIEAGGLRLEIGTVPLSAVCAETTALAESLLRDRPIRFTASVPDQLAVRADARRVQQIVSNLIGNAANYTERGEIALRGSAANGEVMLEVTDTGVGIPPDEHEAIFRAFYRGRRQGNTKGAGLGLSLSLKLATMMGGGIAVHSVPDEGSTFTLRLPEARS